MAASVEFWHEEPNLIRSDEGSIRICGRAGLDRTVADDPDAVYAFVTEGLEAIGFTVESD